MCETGDYGTDAWQPVTTASGELAAYNPATGERRFGREALLLLGQVRPRRRRRRIVNRETVAHTEVTRRAHDQHSAIRPA